MVSVSTRYKYFMKNILPPNRLHFLKTCSKEFGKVLKQTEGLQELRQKKRRRELTEDESHDAWICPNNQNYLSLGSMWPFCQKY